MHRVAVALALAACGTSVRDPAPSSVAPGSAAIATATTDAGAAMDAGAAAEASAAIDAAVAKPAKAERIELAFTGDIMFGGTFSGAWRPQEAGSFDPLSPIAEKLKADLTLSNLETTVVAKIPVDKLVGDLRFAARPDQVATLPRNGVMAVTIANNHAADLDGPGVVETPTHLRDLGITTIGAARTSRPKFRAETIEVKGWKIGFVAATTWLNRGQRKSDPQIPLSSERTLATDLVPVIEAAKADHDLVIVVLHWGEQYVDNPARWQIDAAHAFIDAGAAAVIGHHSHLLQKIERYKDGVIAYSLGNFLFNNALPLQRNTGILRLGFAADKDRGTCLDLLVLHPAAMYPSPVHHPKPLAGGPIFGEIVARMTKLQPRDVPLRVDGDRLVGPAVCSR